MMPLMKNQWNWHKPASVKEYLCLPDSSAELFETITEIKRTQIILQHEHHSFERKHIGTDWRIYLLSSLVFSLLVLLRLLSGTWFGILMIDWLVNYWRKKYMLMRLWIQKRCVHLYLFLSTAIALRPRAKRIPAAMDGMRRAAPILVFALQKKPQTKNETREENHQYQ